MTDKPQCMPEGIQMLTQSLLTEEGFLNEACMNELEAAINNMPETYERLADDPEWTAPAWTGATEMVGLLARYAIQQSVGVPPRLADVIGFAHTAIARDQRFVSWGDSIGKYANISLCDVNRLMWDILRDLQPFNDWNKAEVMCPLGLQWIDLSALLHNVCLSLRTERREFSAFNAKFEEEHGT